jgi:hypothetical protein
MYGRTHVVEARSMVAVVVVVVGCRRWEMLGRSRLS